MDRLENEIVVLRLQLALTNSEDPVPVDVVPGEEDGVHVTQLMLSATMVLGVNQKSATKSSVAVDRRERAEVWDKGTILPLMPDVGGRSLRPFRITFASPMPLLLTL